MLIVPTTFFNFLYVPGLPLDSHSSVNLIAPKLFNQKRLIVKNLK